MNFDKPPDGARPKSSAENMRDQTKERTTDMRRNTMNVQGAKYELALHTLMDRSNEDTDLVNGMNQFLDSLESVAMRGDSGEQLDPRRVEELKKFFAESAARLKGIVGDRE